MRTFYRHILPVLQPLLLAVSLIWTLWFVFAGFGNHMDPPYWLYKYQHLDGGWMSAGTLLFGHLCVRIFGAELLSLRLVGWGITVLAIALPYAFLLTKTQRRNHLHWLALAYFMMGYGTFQELSPGTLTVFLLSILAIVAVRYRHAPSLPKAVLIGLLVGLAVAVRFPNILVLLPIAVLFCLPIAGSNAVSALATAIVVCGAIYGVGADLLTFSVVDPAMGGTHGLGKMFNNLWEKGAPLLGFAALWYGVLAVGRKSWYWAIPVAAGVGYYATYVFGAQWYNIDLTYCISAACIVFTLGTRDKSLLWMLPILIVATLGTDVAWLKLFPAVLLLLPLLPRAYSGKMRVYLFVVLLGLAAAQTTRFSITSIGNSNLRNSTVCASVAPYQGIFIDAKSNTYLEQLDADYKQFGKPDSTISVGQDAHLIRAVTGCKAGCYNEFWSNIFDSVYTAKYEPLIVELRPVVFCAFSPHFKVKKSYHDKHSAFEQMLLRNGYTAVDRSRYQYMIYLPE